MVQVSNTTTHTGARRRSQRVLMQVPVRIRGKNAQGAEFEEFTETLAINAHGSLILLNARLTSGAKVFMKHNKTEEEQECHVAFLGPVRGGKDRKSTRLNSSHTVISYAVFCLKKKKKKKKIKQSEKEKEKNNIKSTTY